MTLRLRIRHHLAPCAAVAALATSALVATPSPSHAADVQIGNECVASDISANTTYVYATAGAASPLPATAPSAGVVTQATIRLPNVGPSTFPQVVRIMRPGAASTYTTVAESASQATTTGDNTFDTRLPIEAGDQIGLYGTGGALVCEGGVGDRVAAFNGDVGVGSTETYAEVLNDLGLPVTVRVEPDIDGDGFGDTTQDLCPQSAAIQSECPVIRLDGFAVAQKNKTLALVSANEDARVRVRGTVKVKGKKFTLKKTRNVKDGRVGKFKLKYPKKMRQQLKKAPASKSYKLKLVAATTDVAGRTTKKKFTVKIPGTK